MASGDILSAIASQKTLEEVKERLGEIGSSGKDISEILEELLTAKGSKVYTEWNYNRR